MTDLKLERDFAVSPERLFGAITSRADLLRWWGIEGVDLTDAALDFTKTGPWFSVMHTDEGQRFKMSGQVTHVDPPNSVGFTWAWHDNQDVRGAESHVTFTVKASAKGALLILDHRELGNDEISANHAKGWASTLRKLDALLH